MKKPKNIGCPTPMHCHRTPRCQDGCEDPQSVKAYNNHLRDKARTKLEEVRVILAQYHDGMITGVEADYKLVELLLNKALDR
jgi:hypothetical protein